MKNNDSTASQIRQHSRQLVRELDVVRGVYLDSGYTLSQCHVLHELSSHQSLTLMELAGILLIDKSNTSRTLKKLVTMGLVKAKRGLSDHRQKIFRLTSKGEKALFSTLELANVQVEDAMKNLGTEQQQQVIDGLQLYANALGKSRLQSGYDIRLIKKGDNPQVSELIRNVMTEFQAVGEGYSIDDPEVDNMHGNYRGARSCYYVITFDNDVVGCGGIAPLKGGSKMTCELRKMFFLSSTRGIGLGRRLLLQLLNDARKQGYRKCYLETLDRMTGAIGLYERYGFERLSNPLGNTGHCSCDRWYSLDLSK